MAWLPSEPEFDTRLDDVEGAGHPLKQQSLLVFTKLIGGCGGGLTFDSGDFGDLGFIFSRGLPATVESILLLDTGKPTVYFDLGTNADPVPANDASLEFKEVSPDTSRILTWGPRINSRFLVGRSKQITTNKNFKTSRKATARNTVCTLNVPGGGCPSFAFTRDQMDDILSFAVSGAGGGVGQRYRFSYDKATSAFTKDRHEIRMGGHVLPLSNPEQWNPTSAAGGIDIGTGDAGEKTDSVTEIGGQSAGGRHDGVNYFSDVGDTWLYYGFQGAGGGSETSTKKNGACGGGGLGSGGSGSFSLIQRDSCMYATVGAGAAGAISCATRKTTQYERSPCYAKLIATKNITPTVQLVHWCISKVNNNLGSFEVTLMRKYRDTQDVNYISKLETDDMWAQSNGQRNPVKYQFAKNDSDNSWTATLPPPVFTDFTVCQKLRISASAFATYSVLQAKVDMYSSRAPKPMLRAPEPSARSLYGPSIAEVGEYTILRFNGVSDPSEIKSIRAKLADQNIVVDSHSTNATETSFRVLFSKVGQVDLDFDGLVLNIDVQAPKLLEPNSDFIDSGEPYSVEFELARPNNRQDMDIFWKVVDSDSPQQAQICDAIESEGALDVEAHADTFEFADSTLDPEEVDTEPVKSCIDVPVRFGQGNMNLPYIRGTLDEEIDVVFEAYAAYKDVVGPPVRWIVKVRPSADTRVDFYPKRNIKLGSEQVLAVGVSGCKYEQLTKIGLQSPAAVSSREDGGTGESVNTEFTSTFLSVNTLGIQHSISNVSTVLNIARPAKPNETESTTIFNPIDLSVFKDICVSAGKPIKIEFAPNTQASELRWQFSTSFTRRKTKLKARHRALVFKVTNDRLAAVCLVDGGTPRGTVYTVKVRAAYPSADFGVTEPIWESTEFEVTIE